MDEMKTSCLVAGSQSNCTSLPDSLNYINHIASENGSSKADLLASTHLQKIHSNHVAVQGQIPSIVIGSNEATSDKLISTLPSISSRRLNNKRATSLLVRFNANNNNNNNNINNTNNGSENNTDKLSSKLSKIERIRMKIYESKPKADSTGVSKMSIDASPSKHNNGAAVEMMGEHHHAPLDVAKVFDVIETTPNRDVKLTEKQQLIRNLTKPFRRQANK